jgi:DNA-binding MarR family transcriptional regulator
LKITDVDMPKKSFIYAAIHFLSNQLQTIGDKLDPKISSKQWFVLAVVDKFKDTPPNIGDVAEVLGTSRQNVKKMANILEKQGFLKLEKDKNDLRTIRLFLTEQCYDYFQSRESLEIEYIERIFSGMDDEMLTKLSSGMLKLIENIDALIKKTENSGGMER